MAPTTLGPREIGKVIYVADVTTKSASKLSTGQVAAIIVCLAVAVIGGFATYAYFMDDACCCCCLLLFERSRGRIHHDDDDDDDDNRFRSQLAGLWRSVRDRMQALGGVIRDKTRRREALPGSDAERDSETKLDDDSDCY